MKNKLHFLYEKEYWNSVFDIKQSAEVFIRFQRNTLGYNFTLDRPSLVQASVWLQSQVIEAKQQKWDNNTIFALSLMFGSYFGECLKKKYGGGYSKEPAHPDSKINTWMLHTSSPSNLSVAIILPIQRIFNGDKDVKDLIAIYDNLHLIHEKAQQSVTSNPLRYK